MLAMAFKFVKFSFLWIPANHYSPESSESPYLVLDPVKVTFAVADFSKLLCMYAGHKLSHASPLK